MHNVSGVNSTVRSGAKTHLAAHNVHSDLFTKLVCKDQFAEALRLSIPGCHFLHDGVGLVGRGGQLTKRASHNTSGMREAHVRTECLPTRTGASAAWVSFWKGVHTAQQQGKSTSPLHSLYALVGEQVGEAAVGANHSPCIAHRGSLNTALLDLTKCWCTGKQSTWQSLRQVERTVNMPRPLPELVQ